MIDAGDARLVQLRDEMRRELTAGILPYWAALADGRRGGFVGLVDVHGTRHPDAAKGGVLHARILWTFSAAFRALGDPALRAVADHAAAFVAGPLADAEHGGVYWMVDADGRPMDDRKHVYAQAFAVYALAEHARATGSGASLDGARAVYALLERHARRAEGYAEAFARDWTPLADAARARLAPDDPDAAFTMNTHLHLVEAYAGLARAWPDAGVRARLAELLDLFVRRIVDAERGHLRPCFDAAWTPLGPAGDSYGHDVEASWLLREAAALVGDEGLRARVHAASLRLAHAVLDEAVDVELGGLFHERDAGGRLDTGKEWWPQAEAIVGFLAAYEETGHGPFARGACRTWEFTRRHVIDAAGGEWHWRVTKDGRPTGGREKVGPWKCPYHTARACLEVMARVPAA